EEGRPRWVSDLQDALDRTGQAVRNAWESTREERVAALESAKKAAKELGDALEKGVDAARQRWDTESGETEPPAGGAETSPPPPDQTSPTPPPATGPEPGAEGGEPDRT
ncbi:MAG: hypothetical protein ACLFWM_11280, partial [Actinomycetota bacterium]